MRLKAAADARGRRRQDGHGHGHGDDDGDGDSPLAADGDDMEKLIAERIAARQRDMDEITERIKASMPPPSQQPQQPHQPLAEYNPNDLLTPSAIHPNTATTRPPTALQSADTRKAHEDMRKVRFQEEDTVFLKLKRKPMMDE